MENSEEYYQWCPVMDCNSHDSDLLINSINDLKVSLVDAIDAAASPLSFESFMYAIFVALVGAAFFYIFDLIKFVITKRQVERSRVARELLETMAFYDDYAVKYWCRSASDIDDRDFIEVKIISGIKLANRYCNKIKSLSGRKDKASTLRLENKISDIYDLATGGDFGSDTHAKSIVVAGKISTSIVEVKAIISTMI